MKNRMAWFVALAGTVFSLGNRPALAQPSSGNPEAQAALMDRAKAFVEAFHKGDAQAVAAFWTPEGDYTDQTGRHLKGREAIMKAFAEMFQENKGLKLRIDIASLRFVTPEVAIEDGTTAVIPPDGGPRSRTRYSIIHVKKDGQWYLESVRDAVYAPATNYEKLRNLEWIIGDWTDETRDGEVARVSFEWTDNENFIVSSYATNFKNITLAAGREWIGWDPLDKRIRSWNFDLEGGFGEGAWSCDGNKLVIKMNSVTRDGKRLAATHLVTRIDANTISWQSKERIADGKPLPDIKEIKMKRQSE